MAALPWSTFQALDADPYRLGGTGPQPETDTVAGNELYWLQEQRSGRLRCSRKASPCSR